LDGGIVRHFMLWSAGKFEAVAIDVVKGQT